MFWWKCTSRGHVGDFCSSPVNDLCFLNVKEFVTEQNVKWTFHIRLTGTEQVSHPEQGLMVFPAAAVNLPPQEEICFSMHTCDITAPSMPQRDLMFNLCRS